jgi:Phage P22-like portal protein
MPYEEPAETQSSDEKLLQEARDRYKYFSEKWRPIREERRVDMRHICGDPWEESDRKARKDAGRPCINHDELGQYIAQSMGNIRSAKRGIKVEPGGGGSSDQTAEFRQNLIRGIEYKSQAQGAYINAFQAMLEGSYGFIRIGRQYVSQDVDGPDDQEIVISNIPNPDSVLYDPDCKKADWSDPRAVFVLDPLDADEFKRQYPDARVTDFSEEDRRVAKDWLLDKQVLVAEYWRVEVTRQWNTRKTRMVEKKQVVQYILTGVEVLERNPQPGECIPIVPFIGIERWVDEGSGPTRKIDSLVRKARDPQMSLAYLCSQQMEEAGLTPKTPYVGYVGQFETDKEAWDTATKIPHAYLQVDPMPDSASGQILPPPRREAFTPNFAAYEVAKDSARRAVQAAMGISPLPTSAQRDNQKSGVALEKIQQSQAVGSYTFVDKYESALMYAGRIVDSWIPVVYDTERELAIRLPDDTHKVVKANAGPYLNPETQQQEQYDVGEGQHDITIGTGPSDASQRDAASDFLDTLIGNLGNIPVAPPQAAKLLSLAIQMKQLGPKGDEMSEIISPTDNQQQQIPPQAQQAIAQSQQENAALHAYAQQQEQKVKELEQEKQARVIDNQFKLKIEQMKIEADLAKAEILARSQILSEREQFVADLWKQLQGQQSDAAQQASQQQHEAQSQAADQAHAQQLQQQQAQAAQQQQAQQFQGQQQLQAQQQAQPEQVQQ